MVELQDGDRSVEIQRDVLELHGFLLRCGPAYFVSRYNGLALDAYLIFCTALSMLVKQPPGRHRTLASQHRVETPKGNAEGKRT
jgi:hypothetical protein